MSQHDYVIDNAQGASFRGDVDAALKASQSQNSGATEPTTTYAYQFWADTNSEYLKQRNSANNGWNILCKLDQDAIAATQAQLYTAFTTGGTATAFTLNPAPAIGANAANQRFRVKFHTAAGATPTLSVSGKPALNLKYYDSTGAKQSISSSQIPSGWVSDVENDGTDWVVLDTLANTLAIASTAEAQGGTDNTKVITPLRLREGLNASGSAPIYACRAWVNFNGTGTPAIRASGNVSSITDNGVGDFTVNFTTALPDVNYAVCLDGTDNATLSTAANYVAKQGAKATGSVRIGFRTVSGAITFADPVDLDVAVFR